MLDHVVKELRSRGYEVETPEVRDADDEVWCCELDAAIGDGWAYIYNPDDVDGSQRIYIEYPWSNDERHVKAVDLVVDFIESVKAEL